MTIFSSFFSSDNIYLHYLVFCIYIHLLGTHIEYLIHKYIMHNEDTGIYGEYHIIHHKYCDDNMNLVGKDFDEYKKLGYEENLTFSFLEVFLVSIFVLIFTFIFIKSYPKKLNTYFLAVIPTIYILYTWIMWNSIHPYIHKRCGREFTIFSLPCSLTKSFAENTLFGKWLHQNHVKHHLYKGNAKGNFNITIPGADFLYNTYN